MIGGGFIGIEVAVNLREAGYEVAVIEAMPQILRTYDYDMVQILHKEMLDHGVELVLGDSVVAFHGSDVELKSGRAVPGDAVVMAVGVRPDTALAVQAGLAANSGAPCWWTPTTRPATPTSTPSAMRWRCSTPSPTSP